MQELVEIMGMSEDIGEYAAPVDMNMDHDTTECHMQVAASLLCKESKETESSIVP